MVNNNIVSVFCSINAEAKIPGFELDIGMITSITEDLVEAVVSRYGKKIEKLNFSGNGLRGISKIGHISEVLTRLDLSKNDLVDIKPLEVLTTLKFLDLSQNSITDPSALSVLSNLEYLDISGNCVKTPDCLMVFANSLTNLRSLNLSGNPICQSIGYPATIFSMLGQVRMIDGLSREEYLGNRSSSPNADESPCCGNSSKEVVDENTKIISLLRARVDSMERVFELQEASLRADGLESARSLNQGATVEQFPYLKLLQTWRKSAFESMTAAATTRMELEGLQAELKNLRTGHSKQLKEHQLQTLSYKELVRASEKKVLQLSSQLEATSTDLKKAQCELSELKHASTHERSISRELGTFLEKAMNQLDSKSVGAFMAIDESGRKLQAMQARILAASKRVEFATSLVAQKEVTMRNSRALSEAVSRLKLPKEQDSVGADKKGEEDDCDRTPSSGVRLSTSTLRPEGEALLRAIFKRLDTGCTGTVSVATLCDVILASSPKDDDDTDGDTNERDNLGALCQEALGQASWQVLTGSLSKLPRAQDLTWGEFLLQFVMGEGDTTNTQPNLAIEDYEDLRRAGAWGDAEWGLVPLDVNVESQVGISRSRNPEVLRLTQERSYLLGRIQDMERSLERRAEVIKSHFEGELRRSKLREMRLRETSDDLTVKCEKLTQRLSDSDATNLAIRANLEEHIEALSAKLEEVTSENKVVADDRVAEMEKTLQVTEARLVRLETEQNLLQKESSKKDVANRGLQRDLVRLQSSLASMTSEKARLAEELQRTDDQLSKALEDHRAETSRRETEWKVEREKLQKRAVATSSHIIGEHEEDEVEEEGETEENFGKDVAEVLRTQMQKIREISTSSQGLRADINKAQTENFENSGIPTEVGADIAGSVSQSDVYAVHLDKLLRLAEEAISSNES